MLLKIVVFGILLLANHASCSDVVGFLKVQPEFSKIEKLFTSIAESYKICMGRIEERNTIALHECEFISKHNKKVSSQKSAEDTLTFPIDANKIVTDIFLYPILQASETEIVEFKTLDEDVHHVRIPLLFPGDATSVEIFSGLNIQISLQCKTNHFGPRCKVFCDDSGSEGSFTCHPKTGEIFCSFGWIGPTCSENVFIDRETASQFIKSRPKRSEEREDCSKRSCTNEEMRSEFLLQDPEYTEENWKEYFDDLNSCKGTVCDANGTFMCVKSEEGFLCRCNDGYKGKDCSEIDLCHFELCQNEASCQTREGQYYCECPEGFEGKFCEIKILRCMDEPCGFHGTCVSEVTGFRCECKSGFTGELCEDNIDDCIENPCGPNGKCHDGDDGYECECDDGYYGSKCETAMDGCLIEPCQNGGVCHGFVDGYFECQCLKGYTGGTCNETYNSTCEQDNVICSGKGDCVEVDEDTSFCQCNVGFEGDYCETEIGYCQREEQACQHNSTCINIDNNDFICLCPSGYEGLNCDVECGKECEKLPLSQCDDNLCENSGRCIYSSVNTTICMCPGFLFTGDRCENRVLDNECERLLGVCKNGAECKNTEDDDGYKCMCTKGFTGMHCDHVIDECYSNPCQNGGECRARDGAFVCDCRIGYHGFLCEDTLDYCADIPPPCKNNGSCEVASLEEHEIKCTCNTRYYGHFCEIKIPVCSVKVESSAGHHGLAEREDCGSYGECVPVGEDDFTCKCKDGYEGEFCDRKRSFIECKDVYCKCTTALNNYKALHRSVNVGDQCFHEVYGKGVCDREKCVTPNCTGTDDLVCYYEADCLKTARPSPRRSNVKILPNLCRRVDLYFDESKFPRETTVHALCDQIRKIDVLKSAFNTTVKCDLESVTSTDVRISVFVQNFDQDIQITANNFFQYLQQLILSQFSNESQKGDTNPIFIALRNASFENRYVLNNQHKQIDTSPKNTPADTSQGDITKIVVPVVLLLVLIAFGLGFLIWQHKRKSNRNTSQHPTSSNNNNIPIGTVKWSPNEKKSEGNSFENPLMFGIDDKAFKLKENPPESPSMARIHARINEERKTDITSSSRTGVSTFVGSDSDNVNSKR